MIARGGRLFIKLSEIGEVNEKDKPVLSYGFKGRLIAEPDRPLACLVVPLLLEVTNMARYSSTEALAADLDALRSVVANLGERATSTPPADDTPSTTRKGPGS